MIRRRLQTDGFSVTFNEKDEWFLVLTTAPGPSLGPINVSKQFIARVGFEFMSLEWLLRFIAEVGRKVQPELSA